MMQRPMGLRPRAAGYAAAARTLAALCMLTAALIAAPALADGPAWIADDYAAARAKAQRENKPLFIDLWAPWCHTCLSMKHFVFPDRSLRPQYERFVWLALDTDKPQNAAALERFRPEVWPTFYVADPNDQSIHARHGGAATLDQLRALMDRGVRSIRERTALGANDPILHLRAGDRAAASKDYAAAATAYRKALALGGARWANTPETLLSLIRSLYRQKDYPACLTLVDKRLADALVGRTAAGSDFCTYGRLCADKQTGHDALARKARTAIVHPKTGLRSVVDHPDHRLSVDDLTDALRILRLVHVGLRQQDAARGLAERAAQILDKAAESASSPLVRMTFSWPRLEVYTWLGRPEAMLTPLRGLATALPEQYDAQYRLASLLLTLGKLDEATRLAKRADALAYGPRQKVIRRLLERIEAKRSPKSDRSTP